MKKSKYLPKIALSCVSLLFIFITGELISKKIEQKFVFNKKNHKVYLQRANPQLHKISKIPGLNYELKPNIKIDNGFYSINSQGIRDREYQVPKPKDVYRIIIVGDSVTFGTEYKSELIYPEILEKLLKDTSPLVSKNKIEVLNAGICGYNAVQKYVFLKEKLLKYQPDLVIFQYLDDDYYQSAVIMANIKKENKDLHINMSIGEYFANNFPQIIPLPAVIDRALMRYSAAYRVINKKIYDKLSEKSPEFYLPEAYKYAGVSDVDYTRAYNQKVFGKLKLLSDEFSFDVILLIVSSLEDDFKLDPWITNYCPNEYGFPVINLPKSIKAKGISLKALRCIPEGDCHFNAQGHKITADIIYDYLKIYLK
ncbi:MAG: hypothetical protein ABIG64_00705 [Candidatus Omnitrophota bacterium]